MTPIVKPDAGTVYDSMGDSMRFVLTGDDTNGQYTLIHDTLKPTFNLGLHLHRDHTELFYVLEGNVTFTVNGQTAIVAPHTTIYVPPNTPHAVSADATCKMLAFYSPAGIEGAMRAFAMMTQEQAQDPAFTREVRDKYDIIDLAAEPIPTLIRFYDHLLAGEVDPLLQLFRGEPYINTPLQGEVKGEAAFRQFVRDQQLWLASLHASPRFYNIMLTDERVVVELIIDAAQNSQPFDLPVALAADRSGDSRDKLSAIRVYHSTWPLNGRHLVRAPLLQPPVEKLREPALIQAYMACLGEPNKALILSLFAEDGYFREPSGSRYKHEGTEGLKHFYSEALDAGGIVLHHCTATFDGRCCAVEFICDEWAHVKFPGQAGLALDEFASPDKIRGARVYDDVMPPFEG